MVIRMRHTRAHTRNRRSHHALNGATVTKDTATTSVHLRHRMDAKTGLYRGRKVLDVALKAKKKVAKKASK